MKLTPCSRPSEHSWAPMKRGSKREQCTKCKTMFPCRYHCDHLDCRVVRGEPLPSWAQPESK